MTTLSNRTLTGLLWMSAGTGGQLLLQLCVLVVLARLLVPKDFGLVAAAQVMVNLATIFTQLGVGPAIVQRLNLETRHLRVGLTLSCMLGITFTAVIALSAPVISEFFRMPDLVSVVQVMSLAFLLKSLAVVPESLMRRELQFRRLAGIEILALAFGFGAVGIGLAWAGYGVWSLVIAYLAQYATASLMFLVVVSHPKTPSLEMSALRELLGFGGGFTLGRIGNYIAGQGDNLVVGRSLGADALGLYGRAHQLMVAPAALIGLVLDRVLFPAMAKVQSRPDRLGVVYLRGVSLIASVTLPLSVVVVFLAPEVIEVLLGIGWEQVVPPFQVLAIGTLFRTSYKISDSLSRATGAVYRRAWRQGVYAFCVVAGAYFGGKWGLVGVSFGVLLAIAVNFTLMAQLSLRLAHLRWRDFLAAHLSAFPLAAVVAVEAWWIASFLRAEHLSASYTLIITVTVIAFTAVILGVLAKRAFIGQQGLWMLETLAFLVRGKAQGSESG